MKSLSLFGRGLAKFKRRGAVHSSELAAEMSLVRESGSPRDFLEGEIGQENVFGRSVHPNSS